MSESHDKILRLCRQISTERDFNKQESLLAELRVEVLLEQAEIRAEIASRRKKDPTAIN
jgi:hypothetical protein